MRKNFSDSKKYELNEVNEILKDNLKRYCLILSTYLLQ